MSDYAVIGLIGSAVGVKAFYDALDDDATITIQDDFPTDHGVSVGFGITTLTGHGSIVLAVKEAAADFASDETLKTARHLVAVLMLELGEVLRFKIEPGRVVIDALKP
jgi:hypothetical protein